MGSNPTGGPLFRVLDNESLLPDPMEISEIDALAEYFSSLHNGDTKYNYGLILLDFYEDLGISKDRTFF